eukprot:15422333-Alexandrium_andersonii.AAC.1
MSAFLRAIANACAYERASLRARVCACGCARLRAYVRACERPPSAGATGQTLDGAPCTSRPDPCDALAFTPDNN